jgi:glycosyltransferase involved in cell wall biosynthesis
MRVLFVSQIRPWPLDTGGALRTHALVRALAGRHAVTLVLPRPRADADRAALERGYDGLVAGITWIEGPAATPRDPADSPNRAAYLLRVVRDGAHWIPSRLRAESSRWRAVLDRLGAAHDAALVRQAALAPALFGFGLRRTVIDADDLMYLYAWRGRGHHMGTARAAFAAGRIWPVEQAIYRRAARVLACSREDAARILSARTTLVPNAVTIETGPPPPREPDTIACLANWRYHPNVSGLRWFMAEVWPAVRAARPAARLRVVGLDATPARLPFATGDGVELVPDVPSVRPWIQSASVSVAPIFIGGGTRIKVLESLAYGTPVVATEVGAAGLTELFGPSEGLTVASDGPGMAAAIAATLAQPGRALADAARGARLVAERYTWDAVVRPVSEQFEAWVTARG